MGTNLQLSRMDSEHSLDCDATPRVRDRRGYRWLVLPLVVWLLGLGAAPAQAQAQQLQYLIGAGDILRISVFKNPDLSLDARVSETGTLSYPLIGSVPVGGLTLPAAEKKLADLLKEGGFVLNPQVN